ncbi:MAG TPA: hypothetical protein VL984_14860 [Acidimicrobiales bacterium]|nr:hypothetical protein [Acidimicrobiales bacterium]
MNALDVLKVLAGAVIVLAMTVNIVRALVIPRARWTFFSQVVDASVDAVFRVLAHRFASYERKDQVLAAQAPAVVLVQLATWLLGYELGYSLALWPEVHHFLAALRETGSSMFTLGIAYTPGNGSTAIDILAGCTGLVVVALQIAYLPTLYGAFNRRETEVTLLSARAGTPSWGPELLLRTRYGVSVLTDDLPELYNRWERWAADVAESHSNYPVLVRFRSPQPLMSWLIALLAIMDSAAMLLSVSPSRERIEPRRAIRMGFTALRQIGEALGITVETDPDPDRPISLSFAEFEAAVEQLKSVGFPMDRDANEAWPHFRGWRVNYESLAYELASRTDQVPAPWSGPRRWPAKMIPVRRPATRYPSKAALLKPVAEQPGVPPSAT